MPTTINDKLISWASDIDPATIRQAEKTARLPDRRGPRRPHARRPRRHRRHRRLGHPDQGRGHPVRGRRGHRLRHGRGRTRRDRGPAARHARAAARSASSGPSPPVSVEGHDVVAGNAERWLAAHRPATELAADRATKAAKQFGTLGSGNHFFELCVDERARVLGGAALGQPGHRQPAGPGAHRQGPQPGQGRSSCASRTRTWRTSCEGTPEFEAYIADMLWAQDYARANRDQMMDNAMREVFAFLGFGRETRRINCHHNFTQREVHDGRGAVDHPQGRHQGRRRRSRRHPRARWAPAATSWRARATRPAGCRARTAPAAGTAGPRPRSCSPPPTWPPRWPARCGCPSRAEALVDEIPSAYKDIDQVMADQADLVEVLHTLHQVLNYKGT